MLNRILCKMNIHNYRLQLDLEYTYTRILDGYTDETFKRIKNSKIVEVCYWCGKVKENSYE